MKSMIFTLLFSTSAFAANICEFRDSQTFTDKVELGEAKVISKTEVDQYSANEREMIFETMKTYSKGWRSYANEYQAVWDFTDRYDTCQAEPGSNAGEIVYYLVEGKKIALVHFWPGDNEYGSIFEIQANGKFKFLAKVSDGEIYCK